MLSRRKVDVSDTGAATAASGGIAVSGSTGDISLVQTGPVVRSAYLEQVRRIAPEELEDRARELDELARFCTESAAGSYIRWQAPAWAGKSALMSWFVLHPPPTVRMVSFFITARFADQSDRIAFIDAVLEQLADLLGEPMPYLTDTTRESHLLAMLTAAAEYCRRHGQRLVLVVDGLDEDRGVTVGPDSHSIAAMLPPRPPAGMCVVVAGRPDPPIPSDVDDNHPLRDPGIVRTLRRSPKATVIRKDAQRELTRLLRGSRAEQDLLGLLTAAGGGLSGPDLAELTGWPLWEIEEHLHAVSGRTFTRRNSSYQPGTAPEVYVLGHEELQQTATRMLSDLRLGGYRQRLHTWADGYRQRGWPEDTPEYVLRGYYRLLKVTGDLPRMIELAADPARHVRMLDVTGGDAAALAEITTLQVTLVESDDPDLVSIARLALHRDRLVDRNIYLPADLPALWVSLGRSVRAEALAHSITDPHGQAEALIAVAEAMAAAGDVDRAEALARSIADPDAQPAALTAVAEEIAAAGDTDRSEVLAWSILDPHWQAKALTAVAQAIAAAGDLDRGEALACSILDPRWQVEALTAVARATVAVGDVERAEALARSIADPDAQAAVLTAVAEAVAVAGDVDRAHTLAALAEANARPIIKPYAQAWTWTLTAQALAVAGDVDLAEAVACSISRPGMQAMAWTAIATATAAAGDLDRAEALAHSMTHRDEQVRALTAVAAAVAAHGDIDRAKALVGTIAPDWQRRARTAVAERIAYAGDADGAEAIIRPFTGADDWSVAVVARAMVAGGNIDRADALARSVPDLSSRLTVLTSTARAMAAAGALDRAQTLGVEAEAVARSMARPDAQAEVLTALAMATMAVGDIDRAEVIVQTIPDPSEQAWALIDLSATTAAAGHLDRARAFGVQAEAAARSIPGPRWRDQALTAVVQEMVAVGDFRRAEAVARSVTDAHAEVWALTALVEAMAAAGELDRAEAVSRSAPSTYARTHMLAALAVEVAADGDAHRARTLSGQAEFLARSITDRYIRASALTAVTKATVAAGDVERAETLARSITDANAQAEAFTFVTEAIAGAGDVERAEAMARSITDANAQAEALSSVAEAMVRTGNLDGAEILFRSILPSSIIYPSPRSLTAVAEAMVAAANPDRAEALTRAITDRYRRDTALAIVTEAMVAHGHLERAEAMARSIVDPNRKAKALTTIAAESPVAHAKRLLASAFHIGKWTAPLDALARLEPAAVPTLADEYAATTGRERHSHG